MDNRCVGAEMGDLAGYPIIEPRADRDQRIGFVHRHVRLIGAMHAEHTDKLLVGARIRTQTHQGAGDRKSQHPHQFHQLFVGVVQDHAAAGVEDRFFRRQHQVDRLFDLPQMTLHNRVVRAHLHLFRVAEWDLYVGIGDILGDIDHHRSGTARSRQVKRLAESGGNVAYVFDQKIVLDTGAGDADGVHFLKSVAADKRGGHLPGQHHHRDGVHIGGRDAGHGIGRAGAGGHQRNTRFAGGTGEAVRRVSRALLMAHQNMFYITLLEQRVVDMQHGPTGIAEYVLDTLLFQTLNDDLGTTQFHDNNLPPTEPLNLPSYAPVM